jgi:hypothetical protein
MQGPALNRARALRAIERAAPVPDAPRTSRGGVGSIEPIAGAPGVEGRAALAGRVVAGRAIEAETAVGLAERLALPENHAHERRQRFGRCRRPLADLTVACRRVLASPA